MPRCGKTNMIQLNSNSNQQVNVANSSNPPHAEKSAEKPADKYQQNLECIKEKLYACAQIDVCICCDITGSMDRYINSVKDSLFELTTDFRSSSMVPRFAFLGYRDKDDEDQYEISDFTTDVQQILLSIERIQCNGGGDTCEDCVGALQRVSELSWRSREKYLLWILDAPAHGRRYHAGICNDDYPLDDQADVNLERLISYYSDSQVSLIIFKCNDSVNAMMEIIKDSYKFYDLASTIHVFKGKLVEELKSTFKQGSSNSIKMIHKSISVSAKEQQVGQMSSEIEWDTTMMEKRFCFEISDGSLEHISFDPPNPGFKISIEVRAKGTYNLGLSRISKGSFRHCYQLYNETGRYVAKINSALHESSSFTKARADLDTVIIGNYFAAEFNKALSSRSLVQFLASMLFRVEEKDLKDRIFCQNRYFIAERFMAGQYVKYNNNNGWVNQSKSDTEIFRVLQAFSHFTFQKSQGHLIIVDLQGTIKDNKILLTDPAVHGHGQGFRTYFGSTNCGSRGISDFFLSHVCNKYCEKLKLDKVALSDLAAMKENAELFKDLTYKLPKIGEAHSATTPQAALLAKKLADLAIYINGLEVFAEDEVRIWLKNYCDYEDLVLLPPMPGAGRKVKIWLKDPTVANTLATKYGSGVPFNGGTARFAIPKGRPEEKKSSVRGRGGYRHGRSRGSRGRDRGRGRNLHAAGHLFHKNEEEKKGGCGNKRDKLGKPHFSVVIHSEEVKEEVIKIWLSSFCSFIGFDVIPMHEGSEGKTKVEVWIKDYTKVDEVLKKSDKLQFMGHKADVLREEGANEPAIAKPSNGPPHICAVLGQFSPKEEEIEEWLSKYFEHKHYELVSKVINGFINTTLKIWLTDPRLAQGLMVSYNSTLKFGQMDIKLFIPDNYPHQQRSRDYKR
eukprot:TRINITY_DN1472_c0_g1_i16.p1 TRINITY_DN1472_c0_g1~~TRINITY_DN1472_c0_g1_i16.p1  ORF type:complete len:901 (+),score=231.30 TRINITY_DN1472_c0_g1_i16:156-2858(+)